MKRKIDAMHQHYGYGVGKCEDCPYFAEKKFDRTKHKCRVYGESDTEETDWRRGYMACGLIDKPFPEGDVRIVRLVEREKRGDDQIKGQIAMDFGSLLDDTNNGN